MFCSKCGQENDDASGFCSACGANLRPELQPQRSKILKRIGYALLFLFGGIGIVFAVLVVLASYNTAREKAAGDVVTEIDEEYYPEDGEEYYPTILSELSTYLEPVGYFDDLEAFESDTISNEEWFSHLHYYEKEETAYTNTNAQLPNQEGIFSSVVKIVCEDEEYFYYGSGTNVDPAGYVLTNHHVVEGLADDACIIGFPDPATGLIKEAYWSTIIIDKDDETGHDLAYLAIEDPVFDEEGYIYGYYDRTESSAFPYFEHTEVCLSSAPQLGDKILVLGYPPLSGGALTVTNGLISSLYSQDGYIITSAKIVSGNSGGLAVDERGCYVGVPSAIYYEEQDEFLGEIIDAEFVFEFDDAILDDLDEYYERYGIVKGVYTSAPEEAGGGE